MTWVCASARYKRVIQCAQSSCTKPTNPVQVPQSHTLRRNDEPIGASLSGATDILTGDGAYLLFRTFLSVDVKYLWWDILLLLLSRAQLFRGPLEAM